MYAGFLAEARQQKYSAHSSACHVYLPTGFPAQRGRPSRLLPTLREVLCCTLMTAVVTSPSPCSTRGMWMMYTTSRREPRTQPCALRVRMLYNTSLAVHARDVTEGRQDGCCGTSNLPRLRGQMFPKIRVHHTSQRSRTAAVPPPCLLMEQRGWWAEVTKNLHRALAEREGARDCQNVSGGPILQLRNPQARPKTSARLCAQGLPSLALRRAVDTTSNVLRPTSFGSRGCGRRPG